MRQFDNVTGAYKKYDFDGVQEQGSSQRKPYVNKEIGNHTALLQYNFTLCLISPACSS